MFLSCPVCRGNLSSDVFLGHCQAEVMCLSEVLLSKECKNGLVKTSMIFVAVLALGLKYKIVSFSGRNTHPRPKYNKIHHFA